MEQKLHKAFYIISMAGLTATIVLLLIVGYMLFWPQKTLTFTDTRLGVVNKEVRSGQELLFKVDYCRYTDMQARVTREIRDGVVYVLPDIQTSLTKGCHENLTISMGELPKVIQPGKYSMHITIEFKPNRLRTITHTLTTEDFFVVK